MEQLFQQNRWDIKKIDDSLIDYNDEIRNFRNILTKIDDSYVISLEAQWGTGKSTFLDILETQLDGLNIIRINAWKQDYLNDPVATIMYDISDQLSDIIDDKTARELKKIGLKLSKDLIPTIFTSLSALLPIPILGNFLNKAVESLVDQLDEQKETLKELKITLDKALASVDSNKIIVFVDELDRCNPNYAIEFLETIKHLFEIKGLIFVLAFEGEVISESLKKVYGNKFNSKNYLKRFINVRIALPEKISHPLIKKSFHDHNLDNIISTHDYYTPEFEVYTNLVYIFSKFYKLTSRDIKQIISNFKLSILLTDINQKSIFITLFLWILKQCPNNAYDEFLYNNSIKKYFESIHEVSGYSLPHEDGNTTFEIKVEIFSKLILSHVTHFNNMNTTQIQSWGNSYNKKHIPTNQKALLNSITLALDNFSRYDPQILEKSIQMVEATNKVEKKS